MCVYFVVSSTGLLFCCLFFIQLGVKLGLVVRVCVCVCVCVHDHIYNTRLYFKCGLDSSVGITTGYGLDGSGIESR
jgi:hypothetical protein